MAGRRPQHRQASREKLSQATPGDTAVPGTAGLPMLRTSERGAVKGCEWRWDLEFNLKRKPQVGTFALRFGTLWHQAMALYYVPGKKRGVPLDIAFLRAYDSEVAYIGQHFGRKMVDEVLGDEKWVNARVLGEAMAVNYMDQYGDDRNWEVLATEQPFEVVVYHPDTYDPNHPPEAQQSAKPWFMYVGVLDGVWRDLNDNTLWIPDHKTTGGIGGTAKYPNMPQHLRIDDQAGSYWSWGVDWLVKEKLLARDARLHGMLYNFCRKAMPDERPSKFVDGVRLYLNIDGSVSKKQPSPYFARFPILRDDPDRQAARDRALIDYRRIELLRAGKLEISKHPGQFSCTGCWAIDLCELHETGNDWRSMLEATTRVWDPYEEHEVYAGR